MTWRREKQKTKTSNEYTNTRHSSLDPQDRDPAGTKFASVPREWVFWSGTHTHTASDSANTYTTHFSPRPSMSHPHRPGGRPESGAYMNSLCLASLSLSLSLFCMRVCVHTPALCTCQNSVYLSRASPAGGLPVKKARQLY